MRKFILLILLIFSVNFLLANTYVVTNTNDYGTGSLRAALLNCLSNPGTPHTVVFNIPTSDPGYNPTTGVWTIVFYDEGLPPLTTGHITIDGTTQTNYAGNTNPYGPEICLNGNMNTVEYCITIQNSAYNVIKGLIINEFLYGIQIYGSGSHHNSILGCYLGCNHDATVRKGNYNAIEIISGANQNQVGGRTPDEQNIVSGNEYAGIRISDAHYNLIINNLVGVNRTGSSELHNYDGITVEGASTYNQIGGDSTIERNVTSGNVAYGIDIFGVGCMGNKIQGNFIGTDITGSYAIANTYGLLFDDRSHQNLVGGYNVGEGNLISGNTAFGAYFYNNGTNSNALIGNKIGTDITGTYAIPNETGVHIDGCTFANLVDSNLISGNLANGITLFATYTDYNTIIRNKIGTDISGHLPLGNGNQGILITQGSANNTIGGTIQNANIIAFNGKNGVKIESENSDHNLISCNSIHSNGNYGIELYPVDGFNPNDLNDSDTGPNDLLNSPVIDTIIYSGSQATIQGHIDVINPTTTKIEIYRALQNINYCSEGKDYLGYTYCNNFGLWSFSFNFLNANDYYTALAIDNANNTSEFSREFPLQPTTLVKPKDIENRNLRIYPNPAYDKIYVDFDTNNENKMSYEVINMLGTIVKEGEFCPLTNKVIEINNLAEGKYIVRLKNEQNILIGSFEKNIY
ncbi:MAG: T9SS type A sorting domain-containing protein [Bacteroidales bacterium]|nr:T9SS type A sorting domain-containing protein [Bacteroidales bacterium]